MTLPRIAAAAIFALLPATAFAQDVGPAGSWQHPGQPVINASSAAGSARGHYITFWGGSEYVMSDAVAAKVRAHNERAAQAGLTDSKPAQQR
jgi:hypothetical protein